MRCISKPDWFVLANENPPTNASQASQSDIQNPLPLANRREMSSKEPTTKLDTRNVILRANHESRDKSPVTRHASACTCAGDIEQNTHTFVLGEEIRPSPRRTTPKNSTKCQRKFRCTLPSSAWWEPPQLWCSAVRLEKVFVLREMQFFFHLLSRSFVLRSLF